MVSVKLNSCLQNVTSILHHVYVFRFISFMHNWTKFEKPSDIEVAYTSERSIEDELDKESRSDIITIFGSYVLMFAYIALALGQIHQCSTLLVRVCSIR